MKKKLLSFLIGGVVAFTTIRVSAQIVEATWTNGGTSLATELVSVSTSAGVSSNSVFAGGLRINGSANQNTGNPAAISDANSLWQRVDMLNGTGTSLYWESTIDNAGKHSSGNYLEFSMKSINASKWLQITDFKIPIIAYGSGDVRMVAKYSVDGVNYRDFYKSGTYWVQTDGNSGVASAVSVTEASPLTLRRNRNTAGTDGGSTNLASVILTFEGLQINVAPGQTFRIRLYPYMRGSEPSASGSRGIQIHQTTTLLGGILSDAQPATDEPPLPLDFLSFTAKTNALGNAVNLDWKTTNEVNTKEFIVEKRTDATDFTAIGNVTSKNTAGVHYYSFIDNNVSNDNIYYRLKQVDKDANFKYSEIQTVKINNGLSLVAYPNPAESVLNITHEPAAKASVKVLGSGGKVLIDKEIGDGSTLTTLDVTSLLAGMYLIVYDNNGEQSSKKFVKK